MCQPPFEENKLTVWPTKPSHNIQKKNDVMGFGDKHLAHSGRFPVRAPEKHSTWMRNINEDVKIARIPTFSVICFLL